MSRAPLIAVTGRCSDTADNVRGAAFSSGQGYSRAVVAAGGLPVIVPPIAARYEQLLDTMSRFDALLLHGGGDVDPRRYGQEPTAEQLYGIVQDHDDLEFALVDAALYLGLPVLAICRGIQVLNVALGGTLVQDLGTESHWFSHHAVDLDPGSVTAAAFGTRFPAACPSVHHQAIDAVAPSLRLVGRAPDGTPEAVDLPGSRWTVGIQWHPEDTWASDPEQFAVFRSLVTAATPV